MKSALADRDSLNQKIGCFLHLNSVHMTTNVSPAKLLLGRKLNWQLELIIPNTRDTVEKSNFKH